MNFELGIAAVEIDTIYPFGKQTIYFEDIVNYSEDLNVDIFFFSPIHWNKDLKTVEGYIYQNQMWLKVERNIPTIIYDRAFGKTQADKIEVEKFRHFLIDNAFHVLNPIPLSELLNSKVRFHKFLLERNLKTLSAYSIDYILTTEFKSLIVKGKQFYIKPNLGTGGFGIYVAVYNNGIFYLRNHVNSEELKFHEIVALFNFIKNLSQKEEYFIQMKADTIDFENRPFDIRVIVQNHSNKDYQVSGMGVRIGEKGSYVSNLNSGGSAAPLEILRDFYFEKFHKSIEEEIEIIRSLCIDCCLAMHEKFGNFLEIGFDILLTKDQGPIILEGNSKPSRWIFNLISDYYKSNEIESKKYRQMRIESVRLPVLFTRNNF